MICVYGSSRVGEIGAGVNTLTVNPLSTISSTLLARKQNKDDTIKTKKKKKKKEKEL